MPALIRTIQDVANHLGAAHPTNESVSRRVYKDTDCGAWAEVKEQPKVRADHPSTFRAVFHRAITGWMLVRVYRGGHPLALGNLPARLREYLNLDSRNVSGDDLSGVTVGDDIVRVSKSGFADYKLVITFRLAAPVCGPAGTELVFRVGSIVEGTDAEVFPETVVLPCTGAQIDKAIACVESAADDIWQETHGCDDCNTDEHDHRINPECGSCGGDGAMI